MSIDAVRVEAILKDCMYKEIIPENKYIMVYSCLTWIIPGARYAPGIVFRTGLNPDKIEQHRNEIYEMLKQLPTAFWDSPTGGGGYTFLALSIDKDGKQWGGQQHADMLMTLGLAAGYIQYLFPIEMWRELPGGVPYIVIHETPLELPVFTQQEVMEQKKISITPIIDRDNAADPGKRRVCDQ